MNERINELIGKALDQAVPYTWHHLNHVQVDDTMKKFAELIVRECVDIAYKFDEPKLSGPGMIIGNRIEEHFGVEE